MERVALNVVTREDLGKSESKRLRVKGQFPAVIYAKNAKPVHVSVDKRAFVKILHKEGENVIIDLNMEKDKKKTVIIKEIQYDTVKEGIFHVDFQQIKLTDKIKIHVPVVTKGDADAPGVKAGGILEHILREVEIECLPTDIPKEIKVDVTGLNVGEAIHVKDIALPEKVSMLTEGEKIAVLVKYEAEEKPAEEAAEETADKTEPEVIKKKKEEEESAEE